MIGKSTSAGGTSAVEVTGGTLRRFAKYLLHSCIRSFFELITSPLRALTLEAGLEGVLSQISPLLFHVVLRAFCKFRDLSGKVITIVLLVGFGDLLTERAPPLF